MSKTIQSSKSLILSSPTLISVTHQLRQQTLNRAIKPPPKQRWAQLRAFITVYNSSCPYNFSAPALLPLPFGRVPHTDCVIFFTNAMRHQTRDLYLILASMDESSDHLIHGDMLSFFEWFLPYQTFLTHLLTAIKSIMIPFAETQLENNEYVDIQLTLPILTEDDWFDTRINTIQRIINKMVSNRRRFLNCSAEVATSKLKGIFHGFATPFMELLAGLEEYIGEVARRFYTEQQCVEIVRAMFSEIKTMDGYQRTMVLLLKWLDDRPETSAKWRKKVLQIQNPIKWMWWRRAGAQEDCLKYFQHKSKTLPTQQDSV